jgi:hypothetical protein
VQSKLASQPSSEPTTEENPEQSASNSEEHNFTRSNLTAPLYDLLSEVLELPDSSTHGWFRKGVAWMATQVVEVAFGGSINDFLYNRIEGLANDQQMANLIDLVNRNIWPSTNFIIARVPINARHIHTMLCHRWRIFQEHWQACYPWPSSARVASQARGCSSLSDGACSRSKLSCAKVHYHVRA